MAGGGAGLFGFMLHTSVMAGWLLGDLLCFVFWDVFASRKIRRMGVKELLLA